MTCSYVIAPDTDMNRYAVTYSTAVVNFELAGVRRRVESVIWSSSMEGLRTIIVRLDEPVPGVRPCPVRTTPYVVHASSRQEVAIIGHPGGRSLRFSLKDSLVLAANDNFIHYRANTEGGRSGSPVFDWDTWQVIAVHSARRPNMARLDGVGTYEACEGISIRAILNAARAGR